MAQASRDIQTGQTGHQRKLAFNCISGVVNDRPHVTLTSFAKLSKLLPFLLSFKRHFFFFFRLLFFSLALPVLVTARDKFELFKSPDVSPFRDGNFVVVVVVGSGEKKKRFFDSNLPFRISLLLRFCAFDESTNFLFRESVSRGRDER